MRFARSPFLRAGLVGATVLGAWGGQRAAEAQAFSVEGRYDRPWIDPERSREWIGISFGLLDRENLASDPIHDSTAFAIDGGYELTLTRLRPAFELGASFSTHQVDDQPTSDRLGIGRVSMGLRLTYFGELIHPYVRGGGYHRWVFDDIAGYDANIDGNGWYAGAGLDFEYQPGLTFGPYIVHYAGNGDQPNEDSIGLSASFRL